MINIIWMKNWLQLLNSTHCKGTLLLVIKTEIFVTYYIFESVDLHVRNFKSMSAGPFFHSIIYPIDLFSSFPVEFLHFPLFLLLISVMNLLAPKVWNFVKKVIHHTSNEKFASLFNNPNAWIKFRSKRIKLKTQIDWKFRKIE